MLLYCLLEIKWNFNILAFENKYPHTKYSFYCNSLQSYRLTIRSDYGFIELLWLFYF